MFTLNTGSETHSGEATRAPGSTKGMANAVGSIGGFLKCEYMMSSATAGAGQCAFSTGARFGTP